VTGRDDQLARHVRRLGNHALNELLLQLPKPSFAALVQVALARPILPAGLVVRFEPAPDVDGWRVLACAPRRRLGTLTRDRDPSGRMVWRAPGPGPATRSRSPASRAGAGVWMLARRWPGLRRSVGPAAWPWPPTSVPCRTRRCRRC
jgi:hypothetical protein